jgi:hypothetical protein
VIISRAKGRQPPVSIIHDHEVNVAVAPNLEKDLPTFHPNALKVLAQQLWDIFKD